VIVPCPTCRGVGSPDRACKGREKCPKVKDEKGRLRFRCMHDACVTCRGRGTIDDRIWYGEGGHPMSSRLFR